MGKKIPSISLLEIADLAKNGGIAKLPENFRRLAHKYGPVFRIRPFNLIVDGSYDDYEYILKSPQFERGKLSTAMGQMLGKGVLISEGEEWKTQRTIMKPMTRGNVIQGFAEHITDVTRAALSPVQTNSRVDFQKIVDTITLESTLGTLFKGVELSQEEKDQILTLLSTMSYLLMAGLGGGIVDRIMPKEAATFKTLKPQVQAVFEHIVIERLHAPKRIESPDLVDLLLNDKMDVQLIIDNLFTFIIAGYDTSSSVIQSTLYLLAENPVWQEVVVQELMQDDAMKSLTLHKVINGALALYPPPWINPREVLETNDLPSGFEAWQGAQILATPYLYAWKEAEAYRNPHEIIFLQDQLIAIFAENAFGAGKHKCVGRNIARLEIPLVVSEIVKRFRLSVPASFEWEPVHGSVLSPKQLVLNVSARS